MNSRFAMSGSRGRQRERGVVDREETAAAAASVSQAMEDLCEALRWHRFDTITGPLIGAAVIFGSIALAALAAWMGGVP